MLPPCSSSLVSCSHSYDKTITNRHPRNDAAACVRCVLHPLPLPLSSCLGCIPPLIRLPFLRSYAVVSSLFLLFVFSIFFLLSRRCPLLAISLPVLFCLLSLLISERFFRFDFVWFRLSCDHGWIRSGSVNVRYDLQTPLCEMMK